jgi:ParB family chromosome partitioning protein
MLEKLNLTQDQLAKKVGKSRSHITNLLGLLRLPSDVQEMINSSDISMGHARILSKLEDENQIKEIAKKIVDEKISVRDVEKLAQTPELVRKNKIERKKSSNEYKYVEDLMRDKLDTKVKISDKKIEISFVNNADLNRILEILDVKE